MNLKNKKSYIIKQYDDDFYYRDHFGNVDKKKKARHFVDTLTQQFGMIPFLVEVLLSEKNEVVEEMYNKMTRKEKRFLFDRGSVPLEETIGVERSLKHKIENIKKHHDKRRKTSHSMCASV